MKTLTLTKRSRTEKQTSIGNSNSLGLKQTWFAPSLSDKNTYKISRYLILPPNTHLITDVDVLEGWIFLDTKGACHGLLFLILVTILNESVSWPLRTSFHERCRSRSAAQRRPACPSVPEGKILPTVSIPNSFPLCFPRVDVGLGGFILLLDTCSCDRPSC